jgi:hypothetical protein
VADPTALHPFESVTVTSYNPLARPARSSVVGANPAPSFVHKKLLPPLPPPTVSSTAPSAPELHVTAVGTMLLMRAADSDTVADLTTLLPDPVVAVTTYNPPARSVITVDQSDEAGPWTTVFTSVGGANGAPSLVHTKSMNGQFTSSPTSTVTATAPSAAELHVAAVGTMRLTEKVSGSGCATTLSRLTTRRPATCKRIRRCL